MQPHNDPLRDELKRVTADAGTLGISAEHVVGLVRRRRQRRVVLGVAVGTAAVVLASTALTSWIHGPRPGGLAVAEPSAKPSASELLGSAGATPAANLFICGQRLVLPDAASSRAGLTMAISDLRYSSGDVGPDITVTFTATSATQVRSSPPRLFEVLYLRDGVIVGGGPMLNPPDDVTPQGIDLVGYGFAAGPGQPNRQDLGRRDALCAPLSWPEIWSRPQAYQVVVLQGPVSGSPPAVSLGVPSPGAPLLASRASLRR